MSKILIIYATKYGQTAKIASVLESELRHLGHEAMTAEARAALGQEKADDYDAVLIGAPVYASKYPSPVKKWVKANSAALSWKPNAFFSVCLGILEKENEAAQRREHEIVQEFLYSVGWKPSLWAIFAGAMPYTKYNWLMRFIMKRIAGKAGGDTDTTQDYEYTDWELVRKLARDLDAAIAARNGQSNRAMP